MNWTKNFLSIAAVASFATPAMADTITLDSSNIGQSYSFGFDGFVDSTTVNGLSSQATFTLTGISGNDYQFSYSVTNDSSNPVTASRVSSFAFNTNPEILSASSTGAFSYTNTSSNYPNGIGTVDVCFLDAATNSCAGGGSGGLLLGETGTGTFTLSFSQPVSSLTLSDFYVRYQSIEGVNGVSSASGAGTLTGSSSTSTSTSTSTSSGGTPVPEPGMIGLMGLALAATALLRRRRVSVRYSGLAAA